ncbi:MAG: ComEC/Rec2 family competence protein [Paracoccaceae bacterium]
MRGFAVVGAMLLHQRGYLFPWTPVCLGLGIGAWFLLRFEPGLSLYAVVGAIGAASAVAALRWPGGWAPVAWAVCLASIGFGLAGARAHGVKAPVLSYRYYGPVEGRVVGMDRSASDALRITLDNVRLHKVPPHRTPGRVRLSLHSDVTSEVLPGQYLMTTAHLSPPSGPAEPGGFDFQRHAWFQGLGAVGYTRNPVLARGPPEVGELAMWVLSVRIAASKRVQSALAGDTGGFAAAVTTGDRCGVSRDALQSLRDSNLAHLLAISGLHMGLLAGFVYALFRISISLIPWLALRVPGHKIAAVAALIAAAVYLALSGRNIATERAFIMVAVALLAVLSDRRALSLRSVAAAAVIVLILRPEALLSPGFQMSFAATTALVAVFGWMRDAPLTRAPGPLRPVFGLLVSSFVAGAATAPVAAAHFNVMAHFGLLANLASVPLMGLVVIPGAVAAVLLTPFGLEGLGLAAMGYALDWILGVAYWVANLPNAVGHVRQPGPFVLPVLSLGALWVMLWQGRARVAGLAVMAGALFVWSGTERPEVVGAGSGGLVGGMTPGGRGLGRSKGQGFVARIWLENDGDGAEQVVAAARWPEMDMDVRVYRAAAWELVHVPGKRALAGWQACDAGQIVVAPVPLELSGPCEQFGPARLRDTGSFAITTNGLITARELSGTRLWHARGENYP